MIIFVSWLGSQVVGLLSLAVQGHWHLFFSQSMKFWVSSGSISSQKKLSLSRWSKPRSHRLQQEKCRPLRFSIWAQLTETSIEVPLCFRVALRPHRLLLLGFCRIHDLRIFFNYDTSHCFHYASWLIAVIYGARPVFVRIALCRHYMIISQFFLPPSRASLLH